MIAITHTDFINILCNLFLKRAFSPAHVLQDTRALQHVDNMSGATRKELRNLKPFLPNLKNKMVYFILITLFLAILHAWYLLQAKKLFLSGKRYI